MSCDKNIPVLKKFFQSFVKYWKQPEARVYISLEKETFQYTDVDAVVLNSKEQNWSARVKECLGQIDSQAVIVLLDDFIIESTVNVTELRKLSAVICENKDVAHFALTTVPMKNESEKEYFGHYYQRAHFGRYKTTLQAGIWNREILMDLLAPGESAWEFEIYGNFRSYLYEQKFYAVSDKKYKPIDYNDGFYCIQGKLNLIEVDRLEKKCHENYYIEEMENNGGVLVRDNVTRLDRRIIRRIKITFYNIKYLVLYWRSRRWKKK